MLHADLRVDNTNVDANPQQSALPAEVKLNVIANTPAIADIIHMGRSCVAWYGFVGNHFDYLIAQHWKIPRPTLLRFVAYVNEIDPNITVSFENIYRQLYFLTSLPRNPQVSGTPFYLSPECHLPLLACCLNHPKSSAILEKFIPRDEAVDWYTVSVVMHANHSSELLAKLFPHLSRRVMMTAAVHRSKPNVQQINNWLEKAEGNDICCLFDRLAGLGHSTSLFQLFEKYPDAAHRVRFGATIDALRGGHTQLFIDLLTHYKINKDEGFDFGILCSWFAAAAALSDKRALSYLFNEFQDRINEEDERLAIMDRLVIYPGNIKFISKLICKTDNTPTNFAVIYSDVETVRFVINHLEWSHEVLWEFIYNHGFTIKPVSLSVVRYFIEEHHCVPSEKLFNDAAQDEDLFRYLQEKFKMTPDREALTCALKGGNIKLFDELCLTHSIKPKKSAFESVIERGNVEMVNRLIDEFALTPGMFDLHKIPCMVIARKCFLSALDSSVLITDKIAKDSTTKLISKAYLSICSAKHYYCLVGGGDEANRLWKEAATHSILLFFAFVVRAVVTPERYKLPADVVPVLRELAQELIGSKMTITEREQIFTMLKESPDLELQQLAESLAPLPQASNPTL